MIRKFILIVMLIISVLFYVDRVRAEELKIEVNVVDIVCWKVGQNTYTMNTRKEGKFLICKLTDDRGKEYIFQKFMGYGALELET